MSIYDINSILNTNTQEYLKCIDQKHNNFKSFYIDLVNDFDLISFFKSKKNFITSNENSMLFKINNYVVKLIMYDKDIDKPYSNINELINNFKNSEIEILNLLSNLVSEYKTPHIFLPIVYGNCKNIISHIKNIDYKTYNTFIKNYTDEKSYDWGLFMISDWCPYSDLYNYIKKNNLNESDWIIIFFKVFFSLSIITDKYKGFRHNDLSCKNILVKSSTNTGFSLYYYDNKYYKIPNNGFEIYLWDFEFSNLYKETDNPEIYEYMKTDYGIRKNNNLYYDIHYFLNTVYNIHELPNEINNFIKKYIPHEYLYKNNKYVKNHRLLIDDFKFKPSDLMNDILFKKYIVHNQLDTLSKNIFYKYNISFPQEKRSIRNNNFCYNC